MQSALHNPSLRSQTLVKNQSKMAERSDSSPAYANPGPLAERLSKLNVNSPKKIAVPEEAVDTESPARSGAATPAKERKSSSGSASVRKPSIGALTGLGMERRESQPPSGRTSRRGSGVITTPSGVSSVYHTRTNVRRLSMLLASPTDPRTMWSSPTPRRVRLHPRSRPLTNPQRRSLTTSASSRAS